MVEVTHKARDVAKSIFAHEEFETACHQLTSFYQSGILEGRRQMREEAAEVAEGTYSPTETQDWDDWDDGFDAGSDTAAAAIRAIPIGDE